MLTWSEFAETAPDLATFGAERIDDGVVYLATTRRDGSPRVHPVTPIIAAGRLFVFMEPTSPKGHDLLRDGRYALHSGVRDTSGAGGEFAIRGRAMKVDNPGLREIAAKAGSTPPADRYILFEFSVQGALLTEYELGRPVRQRWGNF